MGSWKKLLYSNKAALNKTAQTGINVRDLSDIYFSTSADGSSSAGYRNDGAFSNIPDAPMVLKRVEATSDYNLFNAANEDQGQIAEGTLVWGKGAEENTVLVDNGSGDTSMTAGYIPIAFGQHAINDSPIIGYNNASPAAPTADTDSIVKFSTSNKTWDVGTGSIIAQTGQIGTGGITVNTDLFTVNGSTGNTVVGKSGTAGTLTVWGTIDGKAGVTSTSGSFTTGLTAGAAGTAADSTFYGDLTLSKDTAAEPAGGDLTMAGAFSQSGSDGFTLASSAVDLGSGTLTSSGVVSFTDATAASDSTTASVKLTGGLAVAKNIITGTSLGVGSTLTVEGATTLKGDLVHTSDTASFGDGAMTITAGSPTSGITAQNTADDDSVISSVAGGGTNTITIEVNNNSGEALTTTDLAVGTTWYAISTDGETVAMEIDDTYTPVEIADAAAADVVFQVNTWVSHSGDSLPHNAILYTSEPDRTVVNFSTGAQFQGSTVIVDSTNTAITDGVVHINKDSVNATYASTTNPTLVFGTEHATDSNLTAQGAVGRWQFETANGFFTAGKAINSDPTPTNEDVTTASTSLHGIKASGFVMPDTPQVASEEVVAHGLTSNPHLNTVSGAITTINMIACDSAGNPHIWIG